MNKMKVEIWSDVMCPFCYIGKRKFETALDTFEHKDEVEIVWHSFQLNPDMKDAPDQDIYQYLADIKGQSRAWSLQMHDNVAQTAKAVGLDYRFDIAKVANSFDAHRVIQLAKKYKLTDALEERFFKAYFTEGAVISDHETITRLAVEIGLDKAEVESVLSSNQYADDVLKDGQIAHQMGARGVPFFVMDRAYGVSGAQDPSVFSNTLKTAFDAWREENPVALTQVVDGEVCDIDGNCN